MVPSGASNEGYPKVCNHGEGTRAFSWLKAPTSAFIFKTLFYTGVVPMVSRHEIGSPTQLS